jgi:small conductance mechanosensitive channel
MNIQHWFEENREVFWVIGRIAVVIGSAIILNFFVRYFVTSYFKRESPRINVDPTTYSFVKNAFTFLVVVVTSISVIYMIPAFKQIAVTLFAGAGIVAAIVGFASQAAFSNIVNGIFLVIFKPFRIGDLIEIGTKQEYTGRVEDITLRHTIIKNFENKRVIVPNSVISNEIITNRSIVDEKVIRYLDILISFDANVDKAISIIQEECEKHPIFIDSRTPEAKAANEDVVEVRVMRFAEYGIQLRAYVCGENSPESFVLVTDLYKIIKKRFDQEGIEIPLPYMNVIIKNPSGKQP